jgi:hypothetical protein
MEFLSKSDEEVDPIIIHSFGHPLFPFVSPPIQVEVFHLLATYQKLLTANFVGLSFAPANFPIVGGGVQFHHEKSAVKALILEIQELSMFAVNCPGLASVTSGNIICDLNIIFANANILLRLRKF